jgi:replication factor C subunit 3/5
MLWVERHRPRTLADLDAHPEVDATLQRLAAARDFPHLLFYGPSGAGKKTRVMALLRAHFGDAATHVRLEHRPLQATESKTIEVALLSSPYHTDINPADAGPTYDRIVVMQVIRELANTVPLGGGFKVVVLSEADRLSRGAQQALRRTMERYVTTCRLVLVCTSTARLIAPLRSRCLGIRVPAPDTPCVARILRQVAEKERLVSPAIAATPFDAFLTGVAQQSAGNMRRALLTLEASKMAKVDFAAAASSPSGPSGAIPVPDWRCYIAEVAADILAEQTPKQLFEIRGKLYELLSQCIPPDVLLKEIVETLLMRAPEAVRPGLVLHAASYDHTMKMGSKPIVHLEAFVANAMALIKQHFAGGGI